MIFVSLWGGVGQWQGLGWGRGFVETGDDPDQVMDL